VLKRDVKLQLTNYCIILYLNPDGVSVW